MNGNEQDGRIFESLLDDLVILLKYALENGLVPPNVDAGFVLANCQRLRHQAAPDEMQLTNLLATYQLLEAATGDVTADSLRATQPSEADVRAGRAAVGAWRRTEAGRWVLTLLRTAGVALFLIVLFQLYEGYEEMLMPPPGEPWALGDYALAFAGRAMQILEPFIYGLIGACVYLLRVSEQKLRSHEFDPGRKPEHLTRLGLGTLSGGLIVLLINQLPTADGSTVSLAEGALGFLAGYSIEFLFETANRIIAAILPRVGVDTVRAAATDARNRRARRRIEQMLADPNLNAERRQVAEEIHRML